MTQTKSFSLPDEIAKRLDEHVERTSLKASTVVTLALVSFFERVDNPTPTAPTTRPEGKAA